MVTNRLGYSSNIDLDSQFNLKNYLSFKFPLKINLFGYKQKGYTDLNQRKVDFFHS